MGFPKEIGMKTFLVNGAGLAILLVGGCAVPPTTVVNLGNETSFPVDVRLFYDDDQSLPENLIELDGTELTVTIQPGQTHAFSRDCEALQAIFIKDADMRIAPGISPEASTRVYREPGDFGCGDTLTFTFTQNALATDLDIAFSQRN
jgi:hypothetical protein